MLLVLFAFLALIATVVFAVRAVLNLIHRRSPKPEVRNAVICFVAAFALFIAFGFTVSDEEPTGDTAGDNAGAAAAPVEPTPTPVEVVDEPTPSTIEPSEEPTATPEPTVEETIEPEVDPKEALREQFDRDFLPEGSRPLIYHDVRNDATGKWRVYFCYTDKPAIDYALPYYNAYFESDSEIHFIINSYLNTTTRITCDFGTLFVTTFERVDGEEHDAKVLPGGELKARYAVDLETGEVEAG